MRILLACPYAWESPGGVQVHVRELGERLRARGHEVLALAPGAVPPPEPWMRAVGRPVPRFRPEVVHAHEPVTPSTSMFALLRSPAPVVATFHSGATRSRLFDIAA